MGANDAWSERSRCTWALTCSYPDGATPGLRDHREEARQREREHEKRADHPLSRAGKGPVVNRKSSYHVFRPHCLRRSDVGKGLAQVRLNHVAQGRNASSAWLRLRGRCLTSGQRQA